MVKVYCVFLLCNYFEVERFISDTSGPSERTDIFKGAVE